MAEAPNEEPTDSLRARMKADIGYGEERGTLPSLTRIGNSSGKPIFLIPISFPDGALLSLGTVEDQLTEKIPAGDFIRVNSGRYKPDIVKPRSRCRIYILFCAGDNAETAQEFRARFRKRYTNGVQVEEGDELLFHYQLNMNFLHLNCNERGQVTVEDDNGGQIPFASNRLSSGMEFFRNARVVHLRNRHGQYLIAGKGNVKLGSRGSLSKWSVEFILNSNSALRLKSCFFGQYLVASDERFYDERFYDERFYQLLGGHRVLLSLSPLESSSELVPVMEGTQVKLRTHHGTFLRSTDDHELSHNPVTHDLPHRTTIFFDVEVLEREEEGSATERHHETGEGNSVTRSPPGDSGLYRGVYWKLKSLLRDDKSGRKDGLIRGGLGTTALVRELCADLREYFGTIAWISNPQKIDSDLIREEMLSQLILVTGAFLGGVDYQPWVLSDHEFSSQVRCLIVVDNLDDPRTWEKFEEILRVVNPCRVIFIARCEMGSLHSQIERYGRELETYQLEGQSYVPWSRLLEKGFSSPSKDLCQLIVRKCEGLPAAIVFVLGRVREFGMWKASIPSDELCRELQFIQKVLGYFCRFGYLFCFLYLCIFPENSLFSCERVSLLWCAERILPSGITAESDSYETQAKRIFIDLLLIGCIHPVETRSNGQLSTFQVVNRAREIMVSLPFLRDLAINISQGSTHLPENTRYLTVRGRIRDFKDEESPKLSSIVVFDVLPNEDETTTSEASPSGASEALLVPSNAIALDLTGASLQMVQHALNALSKASKLIDLSRSKKMKKKPTDLSLRYLSLSNTSVRKIPGFIGNLEHLEFLDAKHSLVTELPTQLARVKRIRHIMIYHLEEDTPESYKLIGFKASCGIGGFRHLERLCFVEANYTILRDLSNMVNLRHLGITKLRAEHGKELCSSLEKLESLESLDLHAIDEREIIDLHVILRHHQNLNHNLEHLYLHGRLEGLPNLILSPRGLTKIILRWSHLEEDSLAILGNLQTLVELELHQAYVGEQLHFRDGQFLNLQILVLDELNGLESMSLERETLWCLESLTISRCYFLEQIPSGIECVDEIRELTFVDMPHEFHGMIQADLVNNRQLDDPMLEIYFTQWVFDHWETERIDWATGAWQESTGPRIPRVSECLYR